ncbi:MAG TPA: hypothetical protein VGV37_03610 [Aliidongia sp.]|uniref:hypothetical protein n=1 Tax=Aliidongia sp. TaxID=1914230 RepID=UPI002DDD08FB|nr:hypothetical protein [Aliidongia sp.]HEV2673602.1 hypothetical protein [Aliidongia sp.]
MPNFRLYILNGDGGIADRFDLSHCRTETEALAEIEASHRHAAWELRQGARLIRASATTEPAC